MKRRAVSAWLHLSLGTTEKALLALTKKTLIFLKFPSTQKFYFH